MTLDILTRNNGPSDSRRIPIGTITIPKGTTFRNQSEYAAWYTDGVTTEAQTVTLTTNGYYVFYSYDGEATASDYGSRLCGNRIGSGGIDEEVGKRVTHHVMIYAYAFAESMSRDKCGYRAKLDPAIGVRVKGIASRDGIERAMYGLCPRDEARTLQATVQGDEVRTLAHLAASEA